MAKRKGSRENSKTRAIEEFLGDDLEMAPSAVVDGLAKKDVEVTPQLVSNVKLSLRKKRAAGTNGHAAEAPKGRAKAKRGRKKGKRGPGRPAGSGKKATMLVATRSASKDVSFSHFIDLAKEVRSLAARAGSFDALRQVMSVLESNS